MSHKYNIEMTDTFGGEANYSWAKRAKVSMPELTYYGYDGSQGYAKANKSYNRELMRKAKSAMGLTNVRGRVENWGDTVAFYPANSCLVMFINWADEE